LENGADVNAPPPVQDSFSEDFGMTALGRAAYHGHFELVHYFLKIGAEVNASFSDSHYPETALEAAAFHGRLDMVYLLLKAGADMDLPREERYLDAAQGARKNGHIAIVDILQKWHESGGDPDSREDMPRNSKGIERFVELD
jgi:ankyrin repeat protein